MIGIDTNVLVRYIARDDPDQSAKATLLIERVLTRNDPGYLSTVVMAETVWVLTRAYRLPARDVAATIERILQIDVLVVDNEQEMFAAMIAVKQGQGSFSDALIASLGQAAGCSHTLTFDVKASRIAGSRRI